MEQTKTKRGWAADRRLVSAMQASELYYIQQAYGVKGDDPEKKCTTKKIRATIAELKANEPGSVVTRVELMAALESKGLIYHDAPEEKVVNVVIVEE